MEAQARKLDRRPPATPDEIDEPHADVFRMIGWVAAIGLLIVTVGALVSLALSIGGPR